MAIFINRALELKEEGNKLFQKRDNEGAMLRYDKAVKLLPRDHAEVAYLRTGMASCYMHMGLGEYPNAINECNLALEASPRYSKALLKRARCYEALNKMDFAFRDSRIVLNMEAENVSAKEIFERVKKVLVGRGVDVAEMETSFVDVQPVGAARLRKIVKERLRKMKKKNNNNNKKNSNSNAEEKKSNEGGVVVENADVEDGEEADSGKRGDKNLEDKVVVEEKKVSHVMDKEVVIASDATVTRTVKLVHGDDIRWAQLPLDSSVRLVRDIIRDRFPSLKGFLIKYRDSEGDLVTITTTDELRVAASTREKLGSFRLYVTEVSPNQEPVYDGESNDKFAKGSSSVADNGSVGGDYVESEKPSACIEHWIFQFAQLFKNHVGFDSDSYLDIHNLGMKLYTEAMEDIVTGEDAQELFDIAADKFQEMAALAMFNWGNVHMSKARRQIYFPEDGSRETILEKIDIESEASQEVLKLYNKAEESMEKGMQIWEEMEERRLNGISDSDKHKTLLQKLGLDGVFSEASDEDNAEQTANMTSQINLLWGSLLYERSIVEYKLGLPTWDECLEVAVEKFELAGASATDIAVMVKNHCSNENALEGMGFKIDEIVQAWNEMYDAKRWQIGVPSFRLEPLFRRRSPKLHDILENVFTGPQ
ncbi:hypothetical protein BRARA_I04432 [Brassica rapa]|uniref:PB1 domain-containing protein n=1 Tax=Brassica campestris TaxID=3711 RepID=A0A397YA64_BRACM|nr:hypothetical protein BRARA_I04432 [Brassica rapa]